MYGHSNRKWEGSAVIPIHSRVFQAKSCKELLGGKPWRGEGGGCTVWGLIEIVNVQQEGQVETCNDPGDFARVVDAANRNKI